LKQFIGVRFRRCGKVYTFLATDLTLEEGNVVVVDTVNGLSLGSVVTIKDVDENEELPEDIKPVLRVATEDDFAQERKLTDKESYALNECGKIITRLNLEMKLISAEYNLDASHITIYFSAENRVDFRELVRDLSHILHCRVELRQIGPRDEAKILGGYGRCGRELCCAGFLTEFAPVSIKMAKTQDLPLNPLKISGVCGRLLCCLGYENDLYKELRTNIPKNGTKVDTKVGRGVITGSNILSQTVMVTYETGACVEYPLKDVKIVAGAKVDSSSNDLQDEITEEEIKDIID
jgi:cell fate regulator YaaT (PSP1 superfamily)